MTDGKTGFSLTICGNDELARRIGKTDSSCEVEGKLEFFDFKRLKNNQSIIESP